MKKKADISVLASNLRGESVFFPKTQEEPQEEKTEETSSPLPAPSADDQNSETTIPRYHDTNHDTMIPSTHDTTLLSTIEEDILEAIRKTVKKIGKESATHRCTIEEKDASDDIVYLFKKQHIFTSDNEIRRIGTNYIIADYLKNGENSILAKVLKRLNS